MAIIKLFPTKDTTIYSDSPEMNTGIDEILDCSTNQEEVSRSLIKFSTEEINKIVSLAESSYEFSLRGFIANIEGITDGRKILINNISQPWDMGTGRRFNSPITTNGASWKWRDSSTSQPWDYFSESTGSYLPGNMGGGNWVETFRGVDFTITQELYYGSPKDLNINVTPLIELYLQGAPNHGFILRQSRDDEWVDNPNNLSKIQYFSIDTNTIYPPHLDAKFDDFIPYNISSSVMDNMDYKISLENNRGEFYRDTVHKFRINSTPQYPTRLYQTSSLYNTNYHLPLSSSYYAIKDTDTNLMIFDFDETYTRISSDEMGSYFNIYMQGLEPERYYTVLIKVVIGNEVKIFDEGLKFKILNG